MYISNRIYIYKINVFMSRGILNLSAYYFYKKGINGNFEIPRAYCSPEKGYFAIGKVSREYAG